MKAVVFHGLGDIRLDTVPEPKVEKPTDAVVRLTASAICGTDLHMVRGTMPGMVPGTVLGHEGVGVVEAVGAAVRGPQAVGDRVVIPSTICCGHCPYCDAGYTSQCDNANPNGKQAGTAFFGGPKHDRPDPRPPGRVRPRSARRPDAHQAPGRAVRRRRAILLSDIFPTGYFGAEHAEIKPGDTVAVFGCGPVGLFAVASARLLGAGRVFAIDTLPDRLAKARELGAETIDFNAESPVERLKDLTGGVGVLRAIDAVGVDAYRPEGGPAYAASRAMKGQFQEEQKEIRARRVRGDVGRAVEARATPRARSLTWAVQALAKAGTLSIIGVYPETMTRFPIGMAMMKNLTLQMGNCPHRHVHPPADRGRPGRQDRPAEGAHADRADDRRDLGVQGVRQAEEPGG